MSEAYTPQLIEIAAKGLVYPAWQVGNSGPLVVCLHGFPDNPDGFLPLAQQLAAQGYQVVCPWLPGYHPSNQFTHGRHDAVRVRDALLEVVDALLQKKGLQQCHLVGHDWGSVIACFMAQHQPQRFQSLCYISVPYGMSWLKILLRCPVYLLHAWYIAFFQLPRVPEWLLARHKHRFLAWLIQFWSPNMPNLPAMQQSVIHTFSQPGVLRSALDYYRTSMFSLTRRGFYIRRLFNKTIAVPSLALRGEHDPSMPQAAWEVTSPKAFPKGVQVELLHGAGHFVQYECGNHIAQRLIQWFAQHGSTPPKA